MIGFVNMGPGLAYVVGPAFGAMAYNSMGFVGVCILSSSSLLLITWPISRSIPLRQPPRFEADTGSSATDSGGFPLLTFVTFLLVFVSGVGVATIDTTTELEMIGLDVTDTHDDVINAGLALSAVSLSFAIASPIVGGAACPDQYGARAVIAAAPCVLGASALLSAVSAAYNMPYGAHIYILVLTFSLWGVGGAMVVAPATDFISRATGAFVDKVAAQNFITLKVGTFVGSIVGPFTAQHLGFSNLYKLLFAIVTLLGVQFVISSRLPNTEPEVEPAFLEAEASKSASEMTGSAASDGGTGGTVQADIT
jgi:MFS family permease